MTYKESQLKRKKREEILIKMKIQYEDLKKDFNMALNEIIEEFFNIHDIASEDNEISKNEQYKYKK